MLEIEKIFTNFFDTERYTTPRLVNFAQNCSQELQPAFPAQATEIANLLGPVQEELGNIRDSQAKLRSKTVTTDSLLKAYKKEMQKAEPGIAYAFGGRGTAGYLDFFPKGLMEYTRCTKTEALTLMKLSATAATRHTALLKPELVAYLQAQPSNWIAVRDAQQSGQGELDSSRTDRTLARRALETALLKAIFTVALAHPGEPAKSAHYFDFTLLKAARHKSLEKPAQP